MGERPVSSIGTAEYEKLLSIVRRARQRVGMTQRELSAKLGKSSSYIDKVERGVRRLDVIEFCELARAVGEDPRETFNRLADELYPPG